MIINPDVFEDTTPEPSSGQPSPKKPLVLGPGLLPSDPPPPYAFGRSSEHNPRPGSGSNERSRLLEGDRQGNVLNMHMPSLQHTRTYSQVTNRSSNRRFLSFFSTHGVHPPPSPTSLSEEDHFDYATATCGEGWRYYWSPITQKAYWMPVLHLLWIDFYFALAAWIFCFVGVVVGSALLIIMPAGGMVWMMTLMGGRALANSELELQNAFNGPLPVDMREIHQAVFPRPDGAVDAEWQEASDVLSRRAPQPPSPAMRRRSAFRERVTALFTDRQSYRALFYFLVIKPLVSLPVFIVTWVIASVLMPLGFTIPVALRWIKGIGEWQTNIALEALL